LKIQFEDRQIDQNLIFRFKNIIIIMSNAPSCSLSKVNFTIEILMAVNCRIGITVLKMVRKYLFKIGILKKIASIFALYFAN